MAESTYGEVTFIQICNGLYIADKGHVGYAPDFGGTVVKRYPIDNDKQLDAAFELLSKIQGKALKDVDWPESL